MCVLKLLEMQSRIFNSCIPVCAETFEAHASSIFWTKLSHCAYGKFNLGLVLRIDTKPSLRFS